ncbi:MAG: Hpt domain-containing protein [Candidatus Melainabacteria bacterium]|nr:Hpt domain-containing protein [Candidatus Melainabacteria bacterium]
MSIDDAPIDLQMLDTTFGKDGRTDIISTFIEHSALLFNRMNTGFEQHDAEVVIDVAHQIKGMGASIYALELSTHAHELERLAKSETPDWQLMAESMERLKKAFATLSGYLSEPN